MMPRKKITEIILEIVEKIKKGYKPDKIILFGSYAGGKPTIHSDIDIMIIKRTNKKRIHRCVDVRRIVYDPNRGIPFSPLVFTPGEIQRRVSLGDQFIREILQKGRVLYEKK
ncbi:MAG: nucleotidyltransferase domain-containing protein [Candidatus Zixiibacteriota bacterium]